MRRETKKVLLTNIAIFIASFTFIACIGAFLHNDVPWSYAITAFLYYGMFLIRRKLISKGARYMPVVYSVHVAIFVLLIVFVLLGGSLLLAFAGLLCALFSLSFTMYGEWQPGGAFAISYAFLLVVMYVFLTVIMEVEVIGLNVLCFISILAVSAITMLIIQMNNVDEKIHFFEDHIDRGNISYALGRSNKAIGLLITFVLSLGLLSFFMNGATTVLMSMFNLRVVLFILIFLVILTVKFLKGGKLTMLTGLLFVLIPGAGAYFFPVLLVMVLNFLFYESSYVEPNEVIHYYMAADEDNLLSQAVGMSVQDSFFIILLHYQQIVLGVLSITVFLIVGFTGFRLYSSTTKPKRDEQGKETLLPDDTMEKIKFIFDDFAGMFPKFRVAPKHPVRKMFYKKVNGHIKHGAPITASDTPDIIAKKIRPNENIDDLTNRYEETRYGSG